MIDFNDACRYQNYLRNLLNEVQMYFLNDDFATTTVKTHHKSDANKNAADEVETSKNSLSDLGVTPDQLVEFGLAVMDEREKLAVAIAEAKAQADLQIDAACMVNKDKKTFSSYLDRIANMRTQESESTGTAYMMNEIDGKQTPYVYKITTVKKINFDRNKIKGIANRLKREMKEASKMIEKYNLDVQVDFEPRWSEEDSLEDILTA